MRDIEKTRVIVYKVIIGVFILTIIGLIFLKTFRFVITLDGSFMGSLIGAIVSGGIAIYIMSLQFRKQDRKEQLDKLKALQTTKLLIKNLNSFQNFNAMKLLYNVRGISGSSTTENQEEEAKKLVNHYKENKLLYENFIRELYLIRKHFADYISNKILDDESLNLISTYIGKVDEIIKCYNIIIEQEGNYNIFQFSWAIIDVLNAVYDYETYLKEFNK